MDIEENEKCHDKILFDADKEYHEAINESAKWATPQQLRELFVVILSCCQLDDPLKLWNNCWKKLGEDIIYTQRKRLQIQDLQFADEELQQYVLTKLQKLLSHHDKSLADFPKMPVPEVNNLKYVQNTLIREEQSYNTIKEEAKHLELYSHLNPKQLSVYESVMDSINRQKGKLFFLYGAGGTGKTYVYRTLISKLRSEKQIVLPVATSGIAATLLPGGRTAHSRFKIPIHLNEHSMCDIKPNTMMAELIHETALIIWDEAPMAHRHTFEALDRTLKEIMSFLDPTARDKQFGGKTVLLGGDFRQLLPVVKQGSRQDTVLSSLSRSYLWENCYLSILSKNMRVQQDEEEFAAWILQVGNGEAKTESSLPEDHQHNDNIEIDKTLMLPSSRNPLEEIQKSTFPDLENSYQDRKYLQVRAILTPRNETVDEINDFFISKIKGDVKEYLSADSFAKDDTNDDGVNLIYTTKYLNAINCSGLPNHRLRLKQSAPIILLRNINQKEGLCNGTRLIITRLGERVLEAEVLAGDNVGKTILIPRIIMRATDTICPFNIERRQFPIRVSYAMTINNSQGKTMEYVGIYLPEQDFSHGQLYLALSRVASMKGLLIWNETNNKETTHTVNNVVYKEIFDNIHYKDRGEGKEPHQREENNDEA